jgi:hypothetical protein
MRQDIFYRPDTGNPRLEHFIFVQSGQILFKPPPFCGNICKELGFTGLFRHAAPSSLL